MEEKNIKICYALDGIYLFIVTILVLVIMQEKSYIDVAYLIIVTIYYCRIKLHRRKSTR